MTPAPAPLPARRGSRRSQTAARARAVHAARPAHGRLAPETAPPASSARDPRALLRLGLGIELFLLALVAVAPLGGISLSISPLARAWPWLLAPARALFGDALVDGSVPPGRGWPELALFSLLLVGASCVAALGVVRWARGVAADRRVLWLLLGVALVLGLTMVLLPALPSDDLYSYTLYGRISAVYHANPLVAVPADFPRDPFLSLVFWRDVRSVYGAMWLLLSSGLAHLAEALGGGIVAYVLLFKLLGLAAHLLNALLIWGILGVLAPRRQVMGTLLYAWSPLCLLEFCAGGHNDAVMLTFLLLAVYGLARGWEAAAMLALGLSISVKYVPLILLPLYLAWVWRRLRRAGATPWAIARGLAWRVGLVAAVLIVTTLPYWAGPRTLGSLLYSPPAQSLNNSLLEGISWPLRWLAQGAFGLSLAAARTLVDSLLKIGALLAFFVLWLWEFRRARERPPPRAAEGGTPAGTPPLTPNPEQIGQRGAEDQRPPIPVDRRGVQRQEGIQGQRAPRQQQRDPAERAPRSQSHQRDGPRHVPRPEPPAGHQRVPHQHPAPAHQQTLQIARAPELPEPQREEGQQRENLEQGIHQRARCREREP
ncbi:MAG TPA: hypothetical protein VFY89_10650, partial [Ktedonobacterales bacterium]